MTPHTNALLSTAYLPPVQYLSKFACYENVLIESHEFYRKQTFRNRCVILSANGPILLTVPIVHPGSIAKKTSDIQVDYSQAWQKIHCKSIESGYGKSPYFLYYFEELFPLILKKEKFLLDLNMSLLNFLLKHAEINNSPSITETYSPSLDDFSVDYRNTIEPGSGNTDSKFQSIRYLQVFENKFGFTPNLSALDLLFNTGKTMNSVLLKSITS